MLTFYHGSPMLFSKFDLAHILEGDGKVKFGYGVYLTSSFSSAAHYSGANRNATTHYVYTVEVPDLTDDNHIRFQDTCFHQHPQEGRTETWRACSPQSYAGYKGFS